MKVLKRLTEFITFIASLCCLSGIDAQPVAGGTRTASAGSLRGGDSSMGGWCMRRVVGTIVLILLMWCFGLALIVQAEHSRQDDWTEYIELVCLDSKICPELVEAIIEKESSWDPTAVNGDCVGLMQVDQIIHWRRAQELNCLDLMDPYDNIRVGVSILEDLIEKYGEAAPALMFYNAGYSDKLGIRAYENGVISSYASEILERAAELERLHGK